MVLFEKVKGDEDYLAEHIRLFYNEPNFDVLDVVYFVSYDDLFQSIPIHHAIIYFKRNH